MEKTIRLMDEDFTGLCFVNLVDFDMKYGHRRDIDGYARAATEFDAQLENTQDDHSDTQQFQRQDISHEEDLPESVLPPQLPKEKNAPGQ